MEILFTKARYNPIGEISDVVKTFHIYYFLITLFFFRVK